MGIGTLFTEIYEANEILKNDNRLNAKPTNLVYQLYYQYLKFAIGFFYRDCYKDLSNHIPFSQVIYKFVTDGVDNQFLLESPTTPPENCYFYVGIAPDDNTSYTEITCDKFTYDEDTHVLETNGDVIAENNIIYISAYIIGEFEESLVFDEINILNEGMLVPYNKEQQNRNSLLNQRVYGGSQNMYSQSNHISAVHNVLKDQEQRVRELIVQYTYRASPNKLKGLGGGI